MDHEFAPGPDTTQDFRNALGRFGTGITIVTTTTSVGPMGITANSFASVSLDPPLVLWSPAKASRRTPFFTEANHYAIHVLNAQQASICAAFAGNGQAFDDVDWTSSEHGVPLIGGCLARFECRRSAVHDAGDHLIMVGQVEKAATGPGDPLLFFAGAYGGFDKGSKETA